VGAGPLEESPGKKEVAGARIRAFFGLPVPEAERDSLGPFLAACVDAAPMFRWTPVANLHFTVRFIGQVDRAVVERVADRLAAMPLQGFGLELGELGTFKRGRLARVVWLGLRAGAVELTALAGQVDAECVAAGLVGEKRGFQAHLTLARARARYGAALPELPPPPRLGPWRANELVLYQSRPGRAGAVYEALRVVKLE
jgi:2'-5' RNA ligase